MASPAQSGSRRTGALTAGKVSYRSYSAIRACASLGSVAHRDKRWRCFAGSAAGPGDSAGPAVRGWSASPA